MSLAAYLLLAAIQSMQMPDWLAGSWTTGGTQDEWSEEWWTPSKAGIMLGAGRSGKGAVLGNFEHMRIIRDGGGGLSFCAMPQGAAGACFRGVSSDRNSITFENPAHDFPQRVSYRREGEQLTASVSDLDGKRVQQWRYIRIGS